MKSMPAPNRTVFVRLSACLLSAGLTALMVACAGGPPSRPKPVSTALSGVPDVGMAGEIRHLTAQHPGKSGFALIDTNRAAFTDRIALADYARKTLDVQYYIWSSDTIGRILADHQGGYTRERSCSR